MTGRIIIQDLEFTAKVGVTAEERASPQPLRLDLEVEYEPEGLAKACRSDSVTYAIDYADMTTRIVQLATSNDYALVETLARRILEVILTEFSAPAATIWLRKIRAPMTATHGSVGVRLSAHRTDVPGETTPASFLAQVAATLPEGRVLDVAAGRGRNAIYLAQRGCLVDAIDRDEAALHEVNRRATDLRLTGIRTSIVELEDPSRAPQFDAGRYDVVMVFFYLYRPLFPLLLEAVKPGGVLIYETFLVENHERYGHPRRKEFCLAPNELLRLVQGLQIVSYEEGLHEERHGDGPAFTARLVARKRIG